jgi:regulator of protease activity HflC (stomatin/prohibitin superfamily)
MRNRQSGNITMIVIGVLVGLGALGGACAAAIKYERIEPGYVGVSVTKCSGGGVSQTPIPSGIYWRELFCEDVVEYPISMQNLILQGSEGIVVNSSEGLGVEVDTALNFTLEAAKVPGIYSKWRADIESISHKYIRQTIREGLQLTFAKYTAEELYSTKKEVARGEVEKYVVGKLAPEGFLLSQFTVNRIQPPAAVIEAINQKVAMVQQAQRSEQEVRKKQAEAAQAIAVAEGAAKAVMAQASGEAESIRLRAEAQAKANRVLQESLTPALIEYEKMRRWNGQLPTYQGAGTPMIMVK